MLILNSNIYLNSLINAVGAMEEECERINALNVFPVPDGDTGSNMTMTIRGVCGVSIEQPVSLGDCAARAAGAMLRSARGNSGVILSVFFKGVGKQLAGLDAATSREVAAAFSKGADSAYGAVMKPTEGTILTVMRKASERALIETSKGDIDLSVLFEKMLESARLALENTPEQLPMLKAAGVVDAGGCGFVTILEAMHEVMCGGGDTSRVTRTVSEKASEPIISAAAASGVEITYPYCTECIVEKSEELRGEDTADALRKTVLAAGDSVVFVDDAEIIKIHVHTDDPGAVLSEAIKYGSFISVKIENMRRQHSDLLKETQQAEQPSFKKDIGFVAVASGDGVCAALKDLGIDRIVIGGQTMNPSTESLLDAIKKTRARTVYVMPNNSNVILVAEQAASLAQELGIDARIIPSKSIPQGIWAMYAFSPELSTDENQAVMTEALATVRSYSVTNAVRDAHVGELDISEGEFMGLCENRVTTTAPDELDCIRQLFDGQELSYMIVFGGEGVSDEEGREVCELINEAAGGFVDITYIKGNQPVYSFVIAAE